MDGGAWQAIAHGVLRDGHDLATKSPPQGHCLTYPHKKYSVLCENVPLLDIDIYY